MMSAADAEAFLAASHARLDFARRHGEIDIDGERWIVGFVQGAPYKETARNLNQTPMRRERPPAGEGRCACCSQ